MGSPRPKWGQVLCLVKTRFLVHTWLCSHCVHTFQKDEGGNPKHESSAFMTFTSQRPHLLTKSPQSLGFQHSMWGEHKIHSKWVLFEGTAILIWVPFYGQTREGGSQLLPWLTKELLKCSCKNSQVKNSKSNLNNSQLVSKRIHTLKVNH
jgi:hypothetical protein